MQKIITFIIPAVIAVALLLFLFLSQGGAENSESDLFSVGVFVPGVVDGSPTYEMMVAGVEKAVSESGNAALSVVEGGFDQSTWEQGVMSMATGESYDLIITSNPSMPEICASVSDAYPQQRFIVLDGYLAGNPSIYSVLFNQREQAFLAGYFAGLVTGSDLDNANDAHRVGLLAGQEYPIMNDVILPGYELGVRSVYPDAEVDFRVLGNWYDAAKAAEITSDMIGSGVDIILPIAGGGNQGAISAARELGAYIVWYDNSGYDNAPGIVVGSTFVRQDEVAYDSVKNAIEGTLSYGSAIILGVSNGAVAFDTEHPSFVHSVPKEIRTELADVLDRLERGDLVLDMPTP